MNDFIFAGILAEVRRFIRLRKKQKQETEDVIQVHLPEYVKFIIVYIFMFVWIKFVDFAFYLMFGV